MSLLQIHFLHLVLAAVVPDGWLGVYLDQQRAEPVVVEVIPDSPAAKAGLQLGDVIVRVGEQAAPGRERLRATLAAAKPGDRLELLVRRGASEHRVVVKLGERPDAATPKPEPAPRPSRPGTPPQPAGESAAKEPAPAPAAAPASPPAPLAPATARTPGAAVRADAKADAPASGTPRRELEAEVEALRAELAALRRQLEALRANGGRE